MSAIAELEAELATLTGRGGAIATGRAASALAITLDALRTKRPMAKQVILPATLCTSPPAVTALAGFEPVFCDIDPETGQMDTTALKPLIAAPDAVLCVLAAHLYGEPCDIAAISTLCFQAGVYLIEDAAQAWGADAAGRPAGGWGDVALVSFGHAKILDAGGGGAALTDDPALAASLRARAEVLPPQTPEAGDWAQEYRAGYYALAAAAQARPGLKPMIGALCLRRPELYLRCMDEATARAVLAALPETGAELAHRRTMAAIYDETLADRALVRTAGGAPWRYNLLVEPELREEALSALRQAGFDASAWYPCAGAFFTEQPSESWPGAHALERGIVNLWVDRSVNEARARDAARILSETLTRRGVDEGRKAAP